MALATPRGRSALAIIRITGKNCIALFEPLIQRTGKQTGKNTEKNSAQKNTLPLSSWEANRTRVCVLHDIQKTSIDEVMLTIYKAPHSYTGQDSIDISLHGSLISIDMLLHTLYQSGFQEAEPGEFTKRAFLAGKLDLTQAEAVHTLIESHNHQTHSLALQQLSGSVSSYIKEMQTALIHIAAVCNICLDYPDDEIQEPVEINPQDIILLIEKLTDSIQSYDLMSIHREGAVIVLAGLTNAGKSSLFNALLKEDRSIVSDTHGTTRDFIDGTATLKDIPIRLYDTAGLRDDARIMENDGIEKKGIEKSYALINAADIILYTIDATRGITDEDYTQLALIVEHAPLCIEKIIIVWNKTDIAEVNVPRVISLRTLQEGAEVGHTLNTIVPISALHYENISMLQEHIYALIHNASFILKEDTLVISTLRQQGLLQQCHESLTCVLDGLYNNIPLDMISLDVHSALHTLGEIIGEVHNEDILDVMFSEFCVGK